MYLAIRFQWPACLGRTPCLSLACAAVTMTSVGSASVAERAFASPPPKHRASPLADPTPVLERLSIDRTTRAHAAIYDAALLRAVSGAPMPVRYPRDVPAAVHQAAIVLSTPQAHRVPRGPFPIRTAGRSEVARAIESAARATGVSAAYLWRTAERESGLDSSAAASTSTARGLYQFVEQTWLAALWRHGERHGLTLAASIERDPASNRFVVRGDQPERLLRLRHDPWLAARMAGELAKDNRRALERTFGRRVTEGDLYAAHFLGADGAAALRRAAEKTPHAAARSVLPRAAAANPSVFLSGGRPITAAQLLWRLHHG